MHASHAYAVVKLFLTSDLASARASGEMSGLLGSALDELRFLIKRATSAWPREFTDFSERHFLLSTPPAPSVLTHSTSIVQVC
jgi:hypothetical protein